MFLTVEMGGLFSSGLSGGERKRASIACELMANPKVLLVDVRQSVTYPQRSSINTANIILVSINQAIGQTIGDYTKQCIDRKYCHDG